MIASPRRLAALALLVSLGPAPARAGDARAGAVIAERWCSACHVVSIDQKSASADVPPFAEIARRRDPKRLTYFLADPHPKMPDMNLSRREIDDLVAYIHALGPAPEQGEPARVKPARPKGG